MKLYDFEGCVVVSLPPGTWNLLEPIINHPINTIRHGPWAMYCLIDPYGRLRGPTSTSPTRSIFVDTKFICEMMRYLCVIVATSAICNSSAFLQVTPFNAAHINNVMSTAHFMGRKVKPSMVDRRKKRAKRTTSPDLETVRTSEKVAVTDIKPSPPPSQKEAAEVIETSSRDAKQIGQKASSS